MKKSFIDEVRKLRPAPQVYAGLSSLGNKFTSEAQILKRVTEVFNVTEEEIKSPYRKHKYVQARTAYSVILRRDLGYKMREIAELLERDHSSIVCSIGRHDDWMRFYKIYIDLYELLTTRCVGIKRLNDENSTMV